MTKQIPNHKKEIFKEKSTKYCVVVPVINEGERIQIQLQNMKELSNDIDIIIADGGSSDGSLEVEFLKSCNVRALLTKQDSGCKKRMNLATNNGNTWSDKTVLFGH